MFHIVSYKQQKSYTKQESPTSDIFSSVAKVEPSPILEGAVAVTYYTVAADLQDLDEKIKSMIGTTDKIVIVGNRNQTVRVCKVCGKEGQLGHVQGHIEAHHIENLQIGCSICSKIFKSRGSLRFHMRSHKV